VKVHEFLMKRTEKRIEEIGGEWKSLRVKERKEEKRKTHHRGNRWSAEGTERGEKGKKRIHYRGHRERREEKAKSGEKRC